jgi:putative ABC transport system permease protein
VEGLLLSLPAALLGVAVAAVVVPHANSVVSGTAAAAVVIIATVLLAVTGVPAEGAAAARRGGEAVTPRGARPTVRRLVVEAAIVVGAIISALVLRERGFASAGDSTLGADPLMVAVPALVGLAAGVLALRAYPLLSGLIAVVTGWRRGIVLSLASRRAARGRGSSTVLLTLIATASVAGFAIASWTTLQGAAQVIGWQKVGADYRVTAAAGDVPAGFDASAVAGVESVAPVSMQIGYNDATRNTIVAIDAANYDAMTRGTPLEGFLPPEMIASLGPTDDTIPVLATAQGHMRPGETTKLSILGRDVRVRVLAQLKTFATLEPPDNFVIMSYSHLAQVSPPLAQRPPRMLFIDGPPSALAGLSAAVGGQETLELQSQQVVAATLSQTPVGQTVSFGLAAAALAAAAYAAIAVAAAFVLAAADQRAETAYLHVLGLARGQRLRLVFAEHVPATLVAAVLGGLLGVALFNFVRPGLGLPTIVPQAAVAEPSLDASQIAVLLAATLLIVLPAWVLAAVAQREPNLAAAVREGGT